MNFPQELAHCSKCYEEFLFSSCNVVINIITQSGWKRKAYNAAAVMGQITTDGGHSYEP